MKDYEEASEVNSASKLPNSSIADESVGEDSEGLKAEEKGACPTPPASSDTDTHLPVLVELIAPQEAANHLQSNSRHVTSEIRKTLSNVGYHGRFLVQAGFNPDLALRGLKWEEIYIILEDDPLKLDDADALLLSNCIAPYSGILFTPSRAHSLPLPPREDGRPFQTPTSISSPPISSPIVATYNVNISQAVDVPAQTVSTNHNANVPQVRADNSYPQHGGIDDSQTQQGSSNNDRDNQHPTSTIMEEAQTRKERTPVASRSSRRRVYITLSSPLTITSAVNHAETQDRDFSLDASIKIEMSPNENTQDCPPGLVFFDPWCMVEFTSLSMSSDTQETYSLEEVQTSARMTPMSSFHYGDPTDNMKRNPGTAVVQHTWDQNWTWGWNAGVSVPALGINPGVNVSQQETRGLRYTEPVWNLSSSIVEAPSEDALVVTSKLKHISFHTAVDQLVAAHTFKPGPCSIFSSESDDRQLQIRIKTFWSTINASHTAGPLQNLFRSSHAPLFANFWHELSFKLDLRRITAEESLNKGRHQRDIIQGWRTPQDGPHLPSESLNVGILDRLDRTVQCSFPLQRKVVGALRGSGEQGDPVESI